MLGLLMPAAAPLQQAGAKQAAPLAQPRLLACRLPGALSGPRRTSSAGAGSATRPRQRVATAPAAAAAAASGLVTPAAIFDLATLLVLPFYVAMVAAPKSTLTRRLMSTAGLLTAAAGLYALLLLAWDPLPALAGVVRPAAAALQAQGAGGGLRAALPSMPAFAALFKSPQITALAWVHLVLLDLVQARWVYHDGRRAGVPTRHSAVLCFMVGPLGLLCHLVTKAVTLAARGKRGGGGDYVVYRF